MVREEDAAVNTVQHNHEHNNEKSAEASHDKQDKLLAQTSTNQPSNQSQEKDILHERQQKIIAYAKKYFTENIVTGKSMWPYHAILVLILWINVYIRTLPMQINPATGKPGLWDVAKNTWTLGPDLDPFLFLRLAKYIIAHGSLPAVDTMRLVPLGVSAETETQLLPHMIAWTYKILAFFSPNVSIEYAAVVFPVIISLFTVIVFFLFVRKVFEHKGVVFSHTTALIATAYLVTLPSLLPRTIAGIPEKESPGFMFMFLSLYFFLLAWKSDTTIRAVIFGALAGVATGLMGLVWGGVIFLFGAINLAAISLFFVGRMKTKQAIIYVLWLFVSLIIMVAFSSRFSLTGVLFYPLFGFPGGMLLLAINIIVVNETRVMSFGLFKKIKTRLSEQVIVGISTFLFGALLASLIRGPRFLGEVIRESISLIYASSSNRINLTVAENKQPYFVDWRGGFGPFWGEFPIFFWLFFIGSVVLLWEGTARLSRMRNRFLVTGSYTVMLGGIIFSRSSPSSIFNGVSQQSSFFYFGSVILFLATLAYVLYTEYRENRYFDERMDGYVLVLALFIVSVVAGRGAIRLTMVLAVSAAIPAAYLLVQQVFFAWSGRNKIKSLSSLFYMGFAAILVIATFSILQQNYVISEGTGLNHVPSTYTQQWQNAMAWVRQNTPKNAVFGHWWDYGYWVQSIGERATMLDGGNAIGYWNYLMGRHVLTGQNENEALSVLFAHNVSYFLIDSSDIGKYSAYSSIGSDENYDRYSFIATFHKNEQATQTVENTTLFVYEGGSQLDEVFNFRNSDQEIVVPPGTPIAAIVVPVSGESTMEQPYVILNSQNRQLRVPLRYLYATDRLIDFGEGMNAAIYIFPKVDVVGDGRVRLDTSGTAFFLSQRNMRALWVQLYLLNNGTSFELVHTQADPVVEDLRNQGLGISDFIYFRGVRGPIKIWRINYSENETINNDYLLSDFPKNLQLLRMARNS